MNATYGEIPVRSDTMAELLNGLTICLYSAILDVHLPTLLALSTLAFLVYYYLYLPVDLTKDLTDVGYDYLLPSKYGRTKKEMVAQLRRLKKVGNLAPVFPNGWFMLAESNEIGIGEVKHVAALGENFAIFRGEGGISYVLDAYCPHLGANIGVGGKVKGNCVECPFHGWRFNGEDGKCTLVPYADKVPKFAQVKKWVSCEVNDFIYIWYHAEGEEPSWFPSDIPEITSKKFIYRGRNEFLVNCHIQEIPENGSDLAHFNSVHAASILTGSDLRYHERVLFHFFRHNWNATWESSTEKGREHLGIGTLTHYATLFGKVKLGTIHVETTQIGPGMVELRMNSAFGPLIILQTVTPIEPLLQKVVHRIYCPPILSILATIILIGETVMIERDIMIWNHKKYIDKPCIVKEDRALVKYRRWFSQFYSSNSPTFSFQKQNLDW